MIKEEIFYKELENKNLSRGQKLFFGIYKVLLKDNDEEFFNEMDFYGEYFEIEGKVIGALKRAWIKYQEEK